MEIKWSETQLSGVSTVSLGHLGMKLTRCLIKMGGVRSFLWNWLGPRCFQRMFGTRIHEPVRSWFRCNGLEGRAGQQWTRRFPSDVEQRPWEWKSPADFDSQNGRMGPRMGPMGRESPIEWLIVGLNGWITTSLFDITGMMGSKGMPEKHHEASKTYPNIYFRLVSWSDCVETGELLREGRFGWFGWFGRFRAFGGFGWWWWWWWWGWWWWWWWWWRWRWWWWWWLLLQWLLL